MLAVIDETTPFVAAGVCYSLVSCVILSDEHEARSVVRATIPPDRRRPFHWYREGPVAIEAMLDATQKIGVVGRAIVVPCSRRRQEAAREVALRETVETLRLDGCSKLVIASRTARQDGRDRRVLAEVLAHHPEPGSLTYRWDKKSDPLLWIADAVAGAVLDHLTNRDEDRWFDRFSAAVGLTVEYRQLPPTSQPKRGKSRGPS